MDQWMVLEIHRRREALYAQAARVRAMRSIESGRSSGIRGRIADCAARWSDVLASVARAMRENEA